ncbi:MAG: hypothetical protein AAGK21_05910, partial [Bacteroidota bacterium]
MVPRSEPVARWRPFSRRVAVFGGVASALAVLLGATLGIGAWRSAAVTPADLAAAEASAVRSAQAEVTAVLRDMRQLAESIASRPRVVTSLAADSVDAGALDALAGVRRPERTSIEVIGLDGRSIAWAGPAYPRPPGTPPDSLVTRAVRDDASRSALAVWVPVGDTLGG